MTKILATVGLSALTVAVLSAACWGVGSGFGGAGPSNPTPTPPVTKRDPYNITRATPQSTVTMDILTTQLTLGGQRLNRYLYADSTKAAYPAGLPIVAAEGKPLTVSVKNESGTTTNVHWHGLTVPNSQDGPALTIASGSSHTYQFTPTETGTYWYHSHYRSVEQQVGDGMYGPLVVLAPSDAQYNLDEILMLSDIGSSGDGGMMGGSGSMMGGSTADTVNGVTNLNTLSLSGGQIAGLRFINASADNTKTVNFPFDVRVTHVDGYALAKSYAARSITIVPGGRTDVEVALTGTASRIYTITDGSAKISINYKGNNAAKATSPFVAAKDSPVSAALLAKTPDFTLNLAAGSSGGLMSGSGMTWSINGKTYPDTGTMPVKVGQTYKVEFTNNRGMMAVDHPIHIHGAHFQVLSVNGQPTHDDTWYDTYPMRAGTTTDIAVSFAQPGVWMLHCHILAHEDGGMMTSFTAS